MSEQTEREARYAEAIWPGEWLPEDLPSPEIQAVIALADQEQETLALLLDGALRDCAWMEERLRAVEALHEMQVETGVLPWCEADARPWPCPTIAALTSPVESDTGACTCVRDSDGSLVSPNPTCPQSEGDL